jgi:outer membrane protein assembly factor BamA
MEAEGVDTRARVGALAGPTTVPVHVIVRVRERPRFRLRWGVQVADESDDGAGTGRSYRAGLSADLTHLNLLGRGATVGASARLNQDYRAGRVFISTPTTFGLPLRSSLFVTRSREDIGGGEFFTFVRDITSITAEQRIRPWADWVLAYSYQFERNDTYDPEADPDDPFAIVSDPLHIARMQLGVVWDTRDHLVDPTRGWFHSSSFEMSTEGIGSDFRFDRYLLQHAYYRPLPGGLISATGVRFGTGNGFGFDLVPSERFYAGGRDTVRGYAEDSLGAIPDFFGELQGGNAVLILNQEIRFPVWRWLRGGAFLDAGNTFRGLDELSLSRLELGAGFGMRLSTEFLVLRVDYGWRLGEIYGGDRGRWHFAIGHAF